MTLEAVHIAGGYANKSETDRRLLRHLLANRAGLLSGFTVTPKVGSLGVDVAPGEAAVTGRTTASQGFYYVSDAAAASIVWPAPSAQPRIDALVLAVGDTQYGALGAGMGGTVGPKWIVVQGTPAASPSAPTDGAITTAVGAGGWERWSNVAVNPGDTALIAGDLTTTIVDAQGYTQFTPAWLNGAQGGSTFFGRYKMLGPKSMHLRYYLSVASGFTAPSQLSWGMPPGYTLQGALGQQDLQGFCYTSGISQYHVMASDTSVLTGWNIAASFNGSTYAAINDSNFAIIGANARVQGVVEVQ